MAANCASSPLPRKASFGSTVLLYCVLAAGLISSRAYEPEELETIVAAYQRDVDEWRGVVVGRVFSSFVPADDGTAVQVVGRL